MTALVTGGASGIGFVFLLCSCITSYPNGSLFQCKMSIIFLLEELASFGATLYVCDISETLLNESLSEWEQKGFQVSGSICDVSSRRERERLMQTISKMFDGKLNILVS